jgi:hypothetical protein
VGARQVGPNIGQFLEADQFDDALADLGLASDPLTGNRYALAGGNPITYPVLEARVQDSRCGHFACSSEQPVTGKSPATPVHELPATAAGGRAAPSARDAAARAGLRRAA